MPADIPDEQVATFFVNPATVLAMVRHVLKVQRGEWLLQSAAGSTLGRMMIKLGRHDGFKTLNVVRRREAIDELKAMGGDAVISSEDGPIDEQVRRIVGQEGVRHAIDPVGGETGTAVLRSLAAGGRLLLYGTLSGEPISIDPRLMISRKATVEGFWFGHWMRERSIPSLLLVFREIATLIRKGVLDSEIGRIARSTRSPTRRGTRRPWVDTARSSSASDRFPPVRSRRPLSPSWPPPAPLAFLLAFFKILFALRPLARYTLLDCADSVPTRSSFRPTTTVSIRHRSVPPCITSCLPGSCGNPSAPLPGCRIRVHARFHA